MVKCSDQIIHEYKTKASTFMCCRNCQIIYGQLAIFKNNSRRFWSANFLELDDNVQKIVQNNDNYLYCDCKSLIGMLSKDGEVILLKEYMEIIY